MLLKALISPQNTTKIIAACAVFLWAGALFAQEAVIRKNLTERLPNLPKIDEVTKSPIPGIFELRLGGLQVFEAFV